MLNRVPGAIALPAGSANSCAALPTYFGSLSTDNPAGGAFQNVNSENVHHRKSEAMTTLRAPAGLDERCQTCRSTTAPKFLLLATKSRSDGAASLGVMNSVNLVKLCSGRKRKMASRWSRSRVDRPTPPGSGPKVCCWRSLGLLGF